jgi:formamidopyrimidine-DNA glycosylase
VPELPEVETIKRELTPHVIGRTITSVDIEWNGMIREITSERFIKRMVGKTITSLTRRGKYLVFRLDQNSTMLVHLKMSGSFIVVSDFKTAPRFVRAKFSFDDGNWLIFTDPRKFGRFHLTEHPEVVLEQLGIEPLETNFTPLKLTQILDKKTMPIKPLLLDQAKIAGIGNMYADEALYRAGIHPLKQAGLLSKVEITRLHRSIKEVLISAIDNHGASVANYRRPGGETGEAHFNFQVAHRRGEVCRKCATKLERQVIRGRGSYYCPICQPSE